MGERDTEPRAEEAESECDRLRYEAAVAYLERVADARKAAAAYRRCIADADNMLAPGGVDNSRTKVRTPLDTDGVHRTAERHSRSLERWKRGLAECEAIADDASERISAIDSPGLRMLLELRYLDGMTWRQTAATMELAQSTCKAKLRNACLALYPHIPTEYRIPHHQAL